MATLHQNASAQMHSSRPKQVTGWLDPMLQFRTPPMWDPSSARRLARQPHDVDRTTRPPYAGAGAVGGGGWDRPVVGEVWTEAPGRFDPNATSRQTSGEDRERRGADVASPSERQRRRADSNCRIEVLQTSALPLGYGAGAHKIATTAPHLKLGSTLPVDGRQRCGDLPLGIESGE